MYIFILLIMTIFIFRMLFSTFGFLPSRDEEKKEEAVNGFVKKITAGNNKKEQGGCSSFGEIYKNYKNRLKNVTGTVKSAEKKSNDEEEKVEEEIFKKTAEKAAVVILDSFTKKDFKALKDMLTKEMYEIFSKNIKNAEDKKYNYKTVIISFDEVNIIEKDLKSPLKSVKLNFKMKQINFVEDENENIISGSKDKVDLVNEYWTFVKSPTDNFWLLKSIN